MAISHGGKYRVRVLCFDGGDDALWKDGRPEGWNRGRLAVFWRWQSQSVLGNKCEESSFWREMGGKMRLDPRVQFETPELCTRETGTKATGAADFQGLCEQRGSKTSHLATGTNTWYRGARLWLLFQRSMECGGLAGAPWIEGTGADKSVDRAQAGGYSAVNELESGSAAIERAAAEQRGSWVLVFHKDLPNPTAGTGCGVFRMPDGRTAKDT